MINDQDKRAIETMAQCGCDIDTLCTMFQKVSKEDIIAICNHNIDASKNSESNNDPQISINCS